MEINYDMILKYLSVKKNLNQFEGKKNIMNFSEGFTPELKEIFGDKFYRLGITQSINNVNVSFFTSVLTLLQDNYVTLLENEENTFINKLIDELLEFVNDNNLPKSLEEIPKAVLKKYIKDKDISIWLMEILVNKLMVNFLIFDFKTNQVYTVYPNDVMNPWRPILMFAKHDSSWEPIRNQEKKYYSYNDNIIKKILLGTQNIEVKYYDSNIIKKDYFLLDNIREIIATDFKNNMSSIEEEEVDNSEIEENSKTFIKNVDVKINKTKLNKMTKEEIINYINSLNIKTGITTKTTKKELIEIVMSN
jgi:hypothetical protein